MKALIPFMLCPFLLVGQTAVPYEIHSGSELYKSKKLHPPAAPDYARPDAWAALPDKEDAADLTPPGLLNRQNTAQADVFFIYPTIYSGRMKKWNADIYNKKLNKKIDSTTIKYQASLFNGAGRIYAPRYRQAHIRVFFTKRHKEEAEAALKLAYQDIKAAFQYYLDHYNHGRPIIIAGHSQGGLLGKWLLRDFFDGQPLQNQLVVAYLVGWPINKGAYQTIPICETPEQTSCFCSWRTWRYGSLPKKYPTGDTIAVVNPISWNTDETYVPVEMSKGSLLRNFNKIYPQIMDAQIHRGMLWSHRPKFPGSIFLIPYKNYHPGDFNLFYMDVRENAQKRVEAFLAAQRK